MANTETSRLIDGLDFYKLTMGRFIWEHFPDVRVRYAFTNRTPFVALPKYVSKDAVAEDLSPLARAGFTTAEVAQLRAQPQLQALFPAAYFDYLETLTLPPLEIQADNRRLHIETEGTWSEALFWETPVLRAVNHRYCSAKLQEKEIAPAKAEAEGLRRLREKTDVIRRFMPAAKIMPFGARRSYSAPWERTVDDVLLEEIPDQLVGFSTVGEALRLGQRLVGTNAHELQMVLLAVHRITREHPDATLRDHVANSLEHLLDLWWAMYGKTLSVALTDTYGTDFFLSIFGPERAVQWRGFRQDSGDPFEMGFRFLDFYRQHGIDAQKRDLLFSDGLDVQVMRGLAHEFGKQIEVGFGWGTNLTNDLLPRSVLMPLSIVMKPISAVINGKTVSTAKLSDNPAKATGDPELIAQLREAVNYGTRPSQKIVY